MAKFIDGVVLPGTPEAELFLASFPKVSIEDRFNDVHDKLGKFASKQGLSSAQYEALRPGSHGAYFDYEAHLNAKDLLNETQAGKDVYDIMDTHAGSFIGAEKVSRQVWTVAHGGSTGRVSDDRRAKAFIEASRHVPKDMIPAKLQRGLEIDDIESFREEYQPGSEVELSTSAFSSSRATAETFAAGKSPVLIEFDTSNGAQAMPIQNLTRHQAQAQLQEFVALGKFKVDSFEPDSRKSGRWLLKIRQTGMF